MSIRSVRALGYIALMGFLAGGCATESTTGSSGATSSPTGTATTGTPKSGGSMSGGASSNASKSGAAMSGSSRSDSTPAVGSSPSKAAANNAAGVQTDSLQACLARIPSSASAGTKMVAEESCKQNEALRLGIVGTASTKSNDRAASGTQGDTLDACMARIPKDATSGQRMMAEQSCNRDQANR